MNVQFFVDRAKEASTWRGVILVLTALGLEMSPQTENLVLQVGLLVAGALGILTKDQK